jgi:hypothetical protein
MLALLMSVDMAASGFDMVAAAEEKDADDSCGTTVMCGVDPEDIRSPHGDPGRWSLPVSRWCRLGALPRRFLRPT